MPIAPAVRPPIAGAPPTPTVPGAPRRPMAPAPTIPLRTAGPPTAGGPAPTIRLAAPGSATVALKPAGGAATLPKATVQLQAPTRPLGTSFPSASQSATLKVEDDEEEEESANEGVANILAGVGLVAALALLTFQIMTASVWVSAPDNEKAGDWTQLSPF
ncbi:MAG: hypothetical protein H8M99_05245 [Gloeobacteraceae cyanobacterium ES-bin-144]|nr:hypothetical protein [Verrucomicrobiales bacterium]